MTIPTFNAENLRKLTDDSRQPAEVEHADKMFKELQLRAGVKCIKQEVTTHEWTEL